MEDTEDRRRGEGEGGAATALGLLARECLDPEPRAAESPRRDEEEEEEKCEREPMRSVIRVVLPCPLTFRGVRKFERELPMQEKGRVSDVTLEPKNPSRR